MVFIIEKGEKMTVECPYSDVLKKGLREYKICKLTKQMCPFMRICPTKNQVVHTEKALHCELRLREKEMSNVKLSENDFKVDENVVSLNSSGSGGGRRVYF